MLYALDGLREQERIGMLTRDIERVSEATLTAVAFNEPQKLADEHEAALDRARHTPESKRAADEATAARAAQLIAALEGGKVLED